MTTISISPVGSTFSSDYHTVTAKPAGKATFKAFSFGVPKVYFDQHPVSPQWAQEAITSMALDALRIKAIAARNAGEVSFSIEDRLPDFLASLATSGRLTKEEIEAFLKASANGSKAFLLARGHEDDSKLPAKLSALNELIAKGGAPVPPWNETHQALIAAWLDFLGSQEAFIEEPVYAKLLSKLTSMQAKKADLADSL